MKGGKRMKNFNQEIRNSILKNNLRYWQVAEKLHINDGNFSRLLRKELTKEKKDEIYEIIKILKEEPKNEQ
jgi:predicted XRE-type DNA-binding protein